MSTPSQTIKNEQNELVLLFRYRKGLVKQFLLPYLEVKDKIIVLPAICVQIRSMIISPNEDHHFFILV